MKFPLAKLVLFILALLALSGCGIFEIGLEEFPAQATATLLPPLDFPPTVTLVPATRTPFPAQLQPGQPVQITRIAMRDQNNGWGIGQVETDLNDHLLFTRDGGRTWQDRTPPEALVNPPAQGLAATAFFGAEGKAWVIFAGQTPQPFSAEKQIIWRSKDDGQTWQAGSELALTGLQADYFIPGELGFLDDNNGWLLAQVGAGMSHDYVVAFVTADGGLTWQRKIEPEKNPELMGCQKTGLAFSGASNGWLTGNCPGLLEYLFFYTTSDGGQSWSPVNLTPPADQSSDLFVSGKSGCGIPELVDVSARSIMLVVRCEDFSTKRPSAWLYSGPAGGPLEARALPLPFGSIQFINAEEGWLVGAEQNDPAAPGEIYFTADGGQNWTAVIATAWQGTPNFIDAKTGWVVARTTDSTALVYTTNGGGLWEEISPVIGK